MLMEMEGMGDHLGKVWRVCRKIWTGNKNSRGINVLMEMEGMGDHLGKVWRLREGPSAESERKNLQNKPNQECSITSAKV